MARTIWGYLGVGLSAGVIAAATMAVAAEPGGVRIGGDVSISVSTGERTTTAQGEGARAVECVGAIDSQSVEIAGDVTITSTGDPAGCACEGEGCVRAEDGMAPSDK